MWVQKHPGECQEDGAPRSQSHTEDGVTVWLGCWSRLFPRKWVLVQAGLPEADFEESLWTGCLLRSVAAALTWEATGRKEGWAEGQGEAQQYSRGSYREHWSHNDLYGCLPLGRAGPAFLPSPLDTASPGRASRPRALSLSEDRMPSCLASKPSRHGGLGGNSRSPLAVTPCGRQNRHQSDGAAAGPVPAQRAVDTATHPPNPHL